MKSSKDLLNLVDNLLDHETPIIDRRFPKGRGPYAGRQTGLGQSFWLGAVFNLNELHAARREFEKVLSEPQILLNWELEFGNKTKPDGSNSTPGGSIGSGKKTIGMYRVKYRKGDLYSKQTKPYLYSFKYSREKHALHDGRSLRKFITFDEARQLCLKAKIADPRFFTREEIVQVKQHAQKVGDIALWAIPSAKQYDELEKSIVGGVFNCMMTREKWVNNLPPDWSPPSA
jgi:hypothetical protein